MQQDSQITWRRARLADAQALVEIYNESVEGGGHSPVLCKATASTMSQIMRMCNNKGWPTWVLLSGDQIIAWAQIRPITWGPDICHRTGDLSIYVRQDWHGSGVAMRVVRNVYRDGQRYGFDAMTCWILGSNRKSIMIARACRMTQWGCMPRAAHYGDRVDDVIIYGIRFDDERWMSFMEKLDARYERRELRKNSAASAKADT